MMSVEAVPSPVDLADELAVLCEAIQGEVLIRGENGYDDARAVWNALIDRYPLVIVRAVAYSDIQHAVRFAGICKLAVSIRAEATMSRATRCAMVA